MPAYLTDTHCHLNHARFADDVDQTIGRALEANVRRLLVVGYDLESSRRAAELAGAHESIEAVVGIHPEEVAKGDFAADLAAIVEIARDPAARVAAWGEIGLDYYWKDVPRDVQTAAFVAQLDTARSLGLPVVIHCRDAYSDCLDILEQYRDIKIELHCFTGTGDEAQRAVAQGRWLGVGGILTYKSSQPLRDAITAVPLDRILLETDCPYLAPQVHRGKRNEPAYVAHVADALAALLGLPPSDIVAATTLNAEAFFGAPVPATRAQWPGARSTSGRMV